MRIGRNRRRAGWSGLPAIGVHGLRHTYATEALRSGADPKVVSERLGHASVAMTLELYRHVFVSDDQVVADRVAGRLLGGFSL